jgi:hypothetical protein
MTNKLGPTSSIVARARRALSNEDLTLAGSFSAHLPLRAILIDPLQLLETPVSATGFCFAIARDEAFDFDH